MKDFFMLYYLQLGTIFWDFRPIIGKPDSSSLSSEIFIVNVSSFTKLWVNLYRPTDLRYRCSLACNPNSDFSFSCNSSSSSLSDVRSLSWDWVIFKWWQKLWNDIYFGERMFAYDTSKKKQWSERKNTTPDTFRHSLCNNVHLIKLFSY
jgi:hypothetical protein